MNRPQVKIHTAQELYERTRTERSNRDLFAVKEIDGVKVKRLHYLSPGEYHRQTHFVLSLKSRIVAIGSIQANPHAEGTFWIQQISVESKHQGKGFARLVMEAIYEYAVERNLIVSHSSFSRDGQRLKHIALELNERYPQAASPEPLRDWL
ncbi:MAG: GNAT family N-acetyltransferase [Cyanobacteria bacterium SZAS LIN-3]|nr:GNAT family N-acetyltransferase [Cyanobacteria bacterium SZAS LIN-3]MBS2006055.1 GNAT family N-acetyltransferase [Cyanobacteria bacterium SZAS TMP-1]